MIVLRDLTRRYGSRRGIDGVTIDAGPGELVGFLGPNGAGKTTTIRVLLGFLRPTSGKATIFGLDCWRESRRIRQDTGYLPGDLRLYSWMTARSGLALTASVRGARNMPVTDLLARLDLDGDVPVRKMSRGTRQKLGLVLALAHEPRLIVLDEPTSALDPLVRDELSAVLRERAAAGAAIFFSSHTLADVEALCDRVIVVREGRIVADEALHTLRARASRDVTIRFTNADAAARARPPAVVQVHERRNDVWRASLSGDPQHLLAFLHAIQPVDFTLGPPDLEGIFRTFYRDDSALRSADS